MSDLIDRGKAIEAIGEIHSLDYNAQAIKARIEQLPSAQPEIVRCWECKWWELTPDNTMLPDWHKCRFYGTRMHTRDNDFCSKGERRE